MPRASVWIRNDDWDKWQLIDNKAELLSQAINRSEITVVTRKGELKTRQIIHPPTDSPAQLAPAIGIDVTPTKKNNSVATPQPQSELRQKYTYCKAGHILSGNGRCLQKGCKYA